MLHEDYDNKERDDEAVLDALLDDGVVPPALRRQPGERLETYRQFLTYLRLGHKRGYGALAKLLGHDVRGIERLGSLHQWPKRAAVFDQLLADAELRDLLRQACLETKAA